MIRENAPRIYNQRMERLANLEKATNVGYRQVCNDIWTASFILPKNDPKNKYCNKFNYVEIFDSGRRVEMFRIINKTTVRRGRRGYSHYECEHVITTLLSNVLFKFHQIGNIGVFTPEVLNYILSFQSVRNWRLGRCDFRHQFLYKWESVNLLVALFSVPRPFMDEWHFTYDTTSYPWTVNLVRAETQIGCELRRRKNMQGITKEEDAKNLVTRLYMLGYGEGDNQLDISNINNGLPYIDADTITKWGVHESIWTDRRFEDAHNMMATGRKMLEELKNPYISYTVESIDLFKKTHQDFDEFREGKMVRVIDREDDIDIDTRIVEIDKPDITKADITVVIANKDRNIAGSIAALQERTRIHETYAQGSETPITDTIIDNAEPNFPLIHEFFIQAGVVNVQQARLRVRLAPFRANSRAIRGGGGRSYTTQSGGATTSGASSQNTTQGGGATTSSPSSQSTTQGGGATTSSPSSQSTTQDGGATTSGASSQNTTQGGGATTSSPSSQSTTQDGGATTSGASSQSTTTSGGQTLTQSSVVLVLQNTSQDTSLGGAGDAAHRHSIPVHTHPVTNHDHEVPVHSHGMAHTHTIGTHFHRMEHTHTIGTHSHGMAHTHTIGTHSHGMAHTHTIGTHSHGMAHTHTIDPHTHRVILEDHIHDIEFGIFQGERATSISIRVDGNTVPIDGDLNDIDIIPFLRRDGGGRIARNTWHRLEIIPDRQTQISASIFLNVFTNSRGGANL